MSTSMSIREAERLERETRLRIKFAALSRRGDPVNDAHDEYADFFDGLPNGWTAQPIGYIETRHESTRRGVGASGQTCGRTISTKKRCRSSSRWRGVVSRDLRRSGLSSRHQSLTQGSIASFTGRASSERTRRQMSVGSRRPLLHH
jgi:hypothetical protein